MYRLGDVSAHLATLSLTDVPPKVVFAIALLVALGLVAGIGLPWVAHRFNTGVEAEAARRARASANFRARWPADRIRQIPYAELEAEVVSCWQLVIVLESPDATRKGTTAEDRDRQIAELRAWISTLLEPLNAAAIREHRILG